MIPIFFALHTSSGMADGAKLFQASFGLDHTLVLRGDGIVLISYNFNFFSRFLAVSWTDLVQGILMFPALIPIPLIAWHVIGNWNVITNEAYNLGPKYNDIMSGMTAFSIASPAA